MSKFILINFLFIKMYSFFFFFLKKNDKNFLIKFVQFFKIINTRPFRYSYKKKYFLYNKRKFKILSLTKKTLVIIIMIYQYYL